MATTSWTTHGTTTCEGATASEAKTALHHVTAGREDRLDRVRARNRNHGEVFAFEATDGMFEFMENRFGSPAADESPYSHSTD